jgi:hypothetical protein
VTDHFQDGRCRLVGNSSACYKMGNYHPILMKIGTQTKIDMLSSKSQKRKYRPIFKLAAAASFGNSSACYKMGNYRPFLMKFGSQTKTDMFSSIVTKAEVYGHFSRWQPQ